MNLKRFMYGAAGVAIALAVVSVGTAAPASAACRYYKEAYARGIFQGTTGIVARARWRNAVRASYGVGFTRWAVAKDKTMRCRKIQPGSRWHCVARARPCNA